MEAASTTSSADVSSVDGRSVGGGGGGGGADFLNRGMFASSTSNSNSSQQQQPHQQQQPPSGENLLLGGAGGFSLGNGFGNNVDATGIGVGAMAVNSGTSFDLSEFPSLGGSGGAGVVAAAAAAGSGNGLAAALREQQHILAHQSMVLQGATTNATGIGGNVSGGGGSVGGGGNGAPGSKQSGSNLYMLAMTGSNGGNFNMTTEDFPALGGSAVGGGQQSGVGNSVSGLLSNSGSVQPGSSENGLYVGGGLEGGSSQLDGGAGLLGLGGLGGLRNPLPSVPSGSAPAGAIGSSAGGNASGSAAGNALGGDYGLLGLLGVIRMTDADRNSLALGSDLQLLGLNLGSPEQIYSTFASPWSDGGATKEPQYQLPMCYYMQPPALKTGHLSKFQLETLFYIFYALPKDVLQAYAAQELYSREWRYHGELKLWFKRAAPSDGVANSSTGSPQYLYFDINSWERRLFNGSMSQNITNGFLPEDEVRVKFPSS